MLDTMQTVGKTYDQITQHMSALADTCKAVRVDTVKVGYGPHL